MKIQKIKKEYLDQIDSLDLDLIIAHVLKKNREMILSHPEVELNKNQAAKIKRFIRRRINHEPLAYILGHKEFFGLDFKVNESTLIPRPETELIVEKVLEKIATIKHSNNLTILDIGTGSGNIIISLAKNLKNKNINYVAIDISKKALGIAKENIKQHGLNKKIKVIHSNLLNFLFEKKNKIKNRNLIITANLPYLDDSWQNLCTDIKGILYEPKTAWHGGRDGLNIYRNLQEQLLLLRYANKIKNVYMICEIGPEQKERMKKIFFQYEIKFYKDLAQKWRLCEIDL